MDLRKARMADVPVMHALINSHAQKGLMLARSRNALYEGIREFTVACADGQVVGCASLHVLWDDLAEVRSLVIADEYAGCGIGRILVETLIVEAKELGIPRLFALTYVPDFFQKCGFSLVSRDKLPQKVWKECINCPKFPDCDEIAVLMELAPAQLSSAEEPAV